MTTRRTRHHGAPPASTRQSTGAAALRAGIAVVGLLLFAAVPLLLHDWRPDPLPHTWQPGRWITLARRGYLHPDVLPNSLAVTAWLLWTVLATALAREIIAQLHRGAAAAHTSLLPGIIQRLASTWITSLSLLLTLIASRATTAPLPAAVATIAADTPAVPIPSAGGAQDPSAAAAAHRAGAYDIHRTERYDTLRTLAAQRYGDPDLWQTIRDASVGVLQPDGTPLPAGFVALTPGTILHIPTVPAADNPITLVADRQPLQPATGQEIQPVTADHEVLPGENLWSIVGSVYPTLPADDTPAAVTTVFTANHGATDPAGHRLTAPDVINPGMRLHLPPVHPPADPTVATGPRQPPVPTTPAPSSTTPAPSPARPAPAMPSAAASTPTVPPAISPDTAPSPGITSLRALPTAFASSASPAPRADAGQCAPTVSPGTTPPPTSPRPPASSPSPHQQTIDSLAWLAAGGLLATTIVGSWTARRRWRDNHTTPRHTLAPTPPDQAALHTALLDADNPDLLDRVDAALRHLAATHQHQQAGPAPQILLVHPDDTVEVYLHPHSSHTLPAPWEPGPDPQIWTLPADAPLPPPPPALPPPCPALVQLGTTFDGADVLADLEALGSLAIAGNPTDLHDAARAILATLITSPWADLTRIHTLGLDPAALTDPERVTPHITADALLSASHHDIDLLRHALDTAGYPTTLTARVHEPGEEFDPLIALAATPATTPAHDALQDLAALAADGQRGLGVLLPADADIPTRWTLRPAPSADGTDTWLLQPLGLSFALTAIPEDAHDTLAELWTDAAAPLPELPPPPVEPHPHAFTEPAWQVMVRLLGPVDAIAQDGTHADPATTRDRTHEVLAWLVTHRHATRTDLEAALWPRGATPKTIANALSRVRRLLTTLAGDDAEHWLPRFERGSLTLSPHVTSDLDLLHARIHHAETHRHHPEIAIPTLQGAVDLIRGIPAGYPWLDAQMGSLLTTTPINAVILLTEHHLTLGDTTAALTTTLRGLEILPAHTELFALRLRAHAANGDPDALKAEYRAYLRAEKAEPYWDGDTDRDLETLYRTLLRETTIQYGQTDHTTPTQKVEEPGHEPRARTGTR
ncbi:hypothetical protein [Frankia sp. KB5]|uniref:hypothetical protein n=1 Tax=Frankia sp. KB5 TaxID=683318 RepID=UPI000A112B90|nr:hypothetical protein [Frankia sp. KB5]ORT53039.1 hypothetical protein KBI5_08755 [Frankia sp. KB5]